jgi:hypothetical protein
VGAIDRDGERRVCRQEAENNLVGQSRRPHAATAAEFV